MKRYLILLITLFVLVISTKAKTNYWDGNVYDVGTYSTSFNFSETYDANVLGVGLNKEVFFGFRINKEMRMTFSTRGSVVPDTYFLLYDAARSNIIAQSDGVEGDDQAYLECKLSPGQYYMSVTKYGTSQGSITMSIQGKYNNPASNVNAGYYTDEFTYSDTKNTFNYGDSYGLSTSDVTYYFTTTKTFDIDITARFTTGSQKARGYLFNSSGNVLYTGSNGYIYYEKLPPGTYTVIVEGNETDGEIVTQIVGTFPVPGNYYDLGNYEHSFTLTEQEYMDGYDDIMGNELGDIIHRLALDVPMVVYISHENSNEQHTAIHLWNSELNEIGNNISNPSDIPGSNPNQASFKMSLSAGVYYIVSESLEAYTGDSDRTITTNIEGIVLNEMQADLSQNYVYTRTMANEDGSAFIDKIEYFDGLGRPVETVQRKASCNGLDLITYQEYDGFGRKSNSWLPRVGMDGSGKFIPFGNFQELSPEVYDYDAKTYSRSVYDESALNHIVEQYGPGEKWHNSHKGTRMALMTNVVGNDTLNCMLFKVEDEWSNDTVLMLRREGNYTSSQLFVTRTMDEDGNRIFEFKDKLGRLILSRRMQGSDSYDTYYIYNSLGAPLVVLPPKASDLLKADTKTSWNSKDDMALRHYAYLYKYQPSRAQLCRAKKLPGCAWIYYLYDRSNRLVFTQDGNMRQRGEWLFTLPDMSGRTCLTGICHNTFNGLEPINTLIAVEPNESKEFGYSIINDTFTLVDPIVISVNFYDDYNFMNSLFYFDDTRLGYTAQSGYDKRYYTDNAGGLQTGTLTAVMDGTSVDSYLPSVMYYDYRGRLVQTKSGNHLSGEIEEGYFANNFLGAPLKSKHVHSVPNKVPLEEVYTYKYDHIGRLITVTHQLNNRTPVTLTSNKYDALGRLLSNLRNGHINLRTDYTYNVRSWLKGISGNLFTQTLYYNESRANGTNILCYNGNISGIDWRANVSGDNILRGYDFTYDALSRLIKADYLKDNNRVNHFSTSYVYDKNGNIQVLQRYGQTSSTGYGLIDNLTYTLNGNQLLRVDDAASASSYNGGFEFKNGTNAVGEYAYDGNGNLTKDSNKGITGIQYNVLNLPSSITFSDGSSITYTYAADGTKLKTVHKIGSTTTTTDYCDNVIYENNTAKLLLIGEGYVSLNDNKYHYYLKDHQGNNRVVVNQSGSVEETNHYYPFGGVFGSTNNVQPYKYNGKELDSKKGLNWYDYGARHYDMALGRFMSIDPWSERYYLVSPYTYCGNNPVRLIDPDGRGWKEAWPYLQESISGNISFGLNVGFSFGIKGIDLSAQINAGSVQAGSDGLKVTSGVSINTPIVGVSAYDNAYKLDDYKDVKEKGYTVDFLIWSEDHKEITTFDSTGEVYKEINKTEKAETESSVSFSASLGVGGEVKINLEKVWNFVVELFK